MKTCSVCNKEFSLDNYYKESSLCKKCYSDNVQVYKLRKKGWDDQRIKEHMTNRSIKGFKVRGTKGNKPRPINVTGRQVCTKCKIDQPLGNYYTKKGLPVWHCKSCISNYNKEFRAKYRKKRYLSDPNYRLKSVLRNRFTKILKGLVKPESVLNLLGCSVPVLKLHIQGQFKKGMTWDNYGKWHIDHIIPISKFDHTIREDMKQCWHFTNLQPLWAKDNIAKGCRVTDSQFKILM